MFIFRVFGFCRWPRSCVFEKWFQKTAIGPSDKKREKPEKKKPLPAHSPLFFVSRLVVFLLLLSLTMLTLLFPPDSIENKKRMFSVHERWLLWRSRTRAATDDGELVASLFSASLSQSTGLGKTKRKNGKRRTNKKNIKALGKKKKSRRTDRRVLESFASERTEDRGLGSRFETATARSIPT